MKMPFFFRSKKGVLAIATIVAAIVASISTLPAIYPSHPTFPDKQANGDGDSNINTTGQKFIADDIGPCGGSPIVASIVDESGFANITQPYKDMKGFFEFALRPGSTGYLTMVYDFSPEDIIITEPKDPSSSNRTTTTIHLEGTTQDVVGVFYHENISDFLDDAIHISKLNREIQPYGVNQLVQLSPDQLEKQGTSVNVSRIVNVTDSIIRVTYAVDAKPSSAAAAGNPYVFTLFQVCHPGELLIIGDKPYEGPLPLWNESTWY